LKPHHSFVNTLYRDTRNVEPEIYDNNSNNWSHWNSNEKLKENLAAVSEKHSIDLLQKTAKLGTSHGKYCSVKLEA